MKRILSNTVKSTLDIFGFFLVISIVAFPIGTVGTYYARLESAITDVNTVRANCQPAQDELSRTSCFNEIIQRDKFLHRSYEIYKDQQQFKFSKSLAFQVLYAFLLMYPIILAGSFVFSFSDELTESHKVKLPHRLYVVVSEYSNING